MRRLRKDKKKSQKACRVFVGTENTCFLYDRESETSRASVKM